MKDQFPEIPVESYQNPLFGIGNLEDALVICTRFNFTDPRKIMAGLSRRQDGFAWNIFIGEKSGHSSRGQRMHPLQLRQLGSVMQSRLNVLLFQLRVIFEDLLMRPPFGEELNEKFHGNPSPFDNRFPDQNCRVGCNPVSPIHLRSPVLKHGNCNMSGILRSNNSVEL